MPPEHAEGNPMSANGVVIPPDQGPAMEHMTSGRSVVLKLLSDQTDKNLMMFGRRHLQALVRPCISIMIATK